MIPKIAWFYWEGGEMSWLRKQSLKTFRRLNPDWDVWVVDDSACKSEALKSIPHLRGIVLRSDYTRYQLLAEHGGIYFDTDFIFVKPIPEEWLNPDVLMSIHPTESYCLHIACLGASPNNRFYSDLSDFAGLCASDGALLAHQSLGIDLMRKFGPNAGMAAAKRNLSLKSIPFSQLIPVAWDDCLALWSPQGYRPLPENTVAVHWFGGDRLSNEFENNIPKGCLVNRLVIP